MAKGCHVCGKSYVKQRYKNKNEVSRAYEMFKAHIKSHENPEDPETPLANPITYPHACTICNRRFESEQKLQSHIKNKHTETKKQYMCKTCGTTYRTFQQKKDHVL